MGLGNCRTGVLKFVTALRLEDSNVLFLAPDSQYDFDDAPNGSYGFRLHQPFYYVNVIR